MFIRSWKKDIFSIPNLLSLFRLLLIPVYATLYLNATQRYQYLLAGVILAVYDRWKDRAEIQYDYDAGKDTGSSGR